MPEVPLQPSGSASCPCGVGRSDATPLVITGRIGLTIFGPPVARHSLFGLPDSLLEPVTTPEYGETSAFRWCCQRFRPTTCPTEEKPWLQCGWLTRKGRVMAEPSTVVTSGMRDRMDYATAALRGAGSGAVVGAPIGWIFGLLNWVEPLISALVLAGYGLFFGAIVGAVFGLLVHALQRQQRDFHSVSGLRPKYYDVVADVAVADRALQLLASGNRKE